MSGETQEGAEEAPQSPEPSAVSHLPRGIQASLRYSGISLRAVRRCRAPGVSKGQFQPQLDLISLGWGPGPFTEDSIVPKNLAGMFIISETEKELALSLLALGLPSLRILIHKAIPRQASDEAQGWGGAQTLLSLRSKAGMQSTPGKQPNGHLEQQLRMSRVR